MSKDKTSDELIRSACRELIEQRGILIDLLIEARDKITLECYGGKPQPETIKTMKKIEDYLGETNEMDKSV